MLKKKLPGRKKKGRSKRKFMDVMMEDMQRVGVAEKAVRNRVRWRQMIGCGDPKRDQLKEGKSSNLQVSLIHLVNQAS